MKIKNDHGLLIDEDNNCCVGYLMNFEDKGVFSPNGKINVSSEEAAEHNRLLSLGEIQGLDQNCKVGQSGTFYYTKVKGVHTWTGMHVSESHEINGNSITFRRAGKVYCGRLQKEADCFNFKRIS